MSSSSFKGSLPPSSFSVSNPSGSSCRKSWDHILVSRMSRTRLMNINSFCMQLDLNPADASIGSVSTSVHYSTKMPAVLLKLQNLWSLSRHQCCSRLHSFRGRPKDSCIHACCSLCMMGWLLQDRHKAFSALKTQPIACPSKHRGHTDKSRTL